MYASNVLSVRFFISEIRSSFHFLFLSDGTGVA